jgi:hypothetical protein
VQTFELAIRAQGLNSILIPVLPQEGSTYPHVYNAWI